MEAEGGEAPAVRVIAQARASGVGSCAAERGSREFDEGEERSGERPAALVPGEQEKKRPGDGWSPAEPPDFPPTEGEKSSRSMAPQGRSCPVPDVGMRGPTPIGCTSARGAG